MKPLTCRSKRSRTRHWIKSGSIPILGAIADTPFYIGEQEFEYWKHTHLTIDVVPGRGSGFSLETPEGMRFRVRSRLFTDDEYHALEGEGAPPRGEQPPS